MEVNNQYHTYLIFGFIAVIALNFICNAIFMVIDFFVNHIFRKNRVKSKEPKPDKNFKAQNIKFILKQLAHRPTDKTLEKNKNTQLR